MFRKSCSFEGCERAGRLTKGLCPGHYTQLRAGKELTPLRKRLPAFCAFQGCIALSVALGYCSGHYSQHRAGKELTPLRTQVRRQTLLDIPAPRV